MFNLDKSKTAWIVVFKRAKSNEIYYLVPVIFAEGDTVPLILMYDSF